MTTMILLRGNSGCGKTTLANQLAARLPAKATLVLHQDLLRRELLHASDHAGTPAVDLIATLATFGQRHYRYVIIEGILRRDVYGDMLAALYAQFRPTAFAYYLNMDFAATLRRDALKPAPFGETNLRRWWREGDQLPFDQVLAAGETARLTQQIYLEVAHHEQITD
jgi:deoxyadenosine/deoxycytidine kinase